MHHQDCCDSGGQGLEQTVRSTKKVFDIHNTAKEQSRVSEPSSSSMISQSKTFLTTNSKSENTYSSEEDDDSDIDYYERRIDKIKKEKRSKRIILDHGAVGGVLQGLNDKIFDTTRVFNGVTLDEQIKTNLKNNGMEYITHLVGPTKKRGKKRTKRDERWVEGVLERLTEDEKTMAKGSTDIYHKIAKLRNPEAHPPISVPEALRLLEEDKAHGKYWVGMEKERRMAEAYISTNPRTMFGEEIFPPTGGDFGIHELDEEEERLTRKLEKKKEKRAQKIAAAHRKHFRESVSDVECSRPNKRQK